LLGGFQKWKADGRPTARSGGNGNQTRASAPVLWELKAGG
jgi:3-mercaptopyruvate sulfurtransferase SseA